MSVGRDTMVRDSLTGLRNMLSFEDLAEVMFANLQRRARQAVFARIEIANLKAVRATEGDETADTLVRAVASILALHTRASDVVARVSDGAFALLMTDMDPSFVNTYFAHLMTRLEAAEVSTQNGLVRAVLNAGVSISREGSVEERLAHAHELAADARHMGPGKHQIEMVVTE